MLTSMADVYQCMRTTLFGLWMLLPHCAISLLGSPRLAAFQQKETRFEEANGQFGATPGWVHTSVRSIICHLLFGSSSTTLAD